MSQNSIFTALKYEKLTVSETKNSSQYFVKNKQQSQITIPSFKTLINSRCKTSQTQQDRSPKTTTRRTQHTNYDVSDRLLPRSEEILQIYDEFEKNYDNVKMLNSNHLAQFSYNDQSIMEFTHKQQSNPQISYQPNLTQADLNYYMKLSILRFRFQYYRIKIKHKQCPIQITFQSAAQQTYLRSYFSLKIEFPTKFNADYQITAKSIRIFTNDNGQSFSEEYLYMTLYSQTDFQCTVIVNFGYERQRNAAKSVKQEFITEEDYIPRKRKQKLPLKQPAPDLRLQNLLNPETLEQLKSQRQIKQQRVRLAGKSITEERQIEMKSKLFVKDQIIQYREVEKQLKQRVTYRTALQKIWLKTIFSTIFFHHLHYFLETACQSRGKRKIACLVVQDKIFNICKGFWGNSRTKNIIQNKNVAECALQFNKKAATQKSQRYYDLIHAISYFNNQYLKQASELDQQKYVFIQNKVIYVQKNYRIMKNKRRVYKEKIWRLIKEEFDDIVHDLIQMKGITNNFYEYEEKPHLHLDTYKILLNRVLMFQILDEFAQKKKKIWQKYIHDTYVVNNPKNRLINFAINFRVPQLFQLPNELEIREIIEKYAIIKKLI